MKARAKLAALAALVAACLACNLYYNTNAEARGGSFTAPQEYDYAALNEVPEDTWQACKSYHDQYAKEQMHLPRAEVEPLIESFAAESGLVAHPSWRDSLPLDRDGMSNDLGTTRTDSPYSEERRSIQVRHDELGNPQYVLTVYCNWHETPPGASRPQNRSKTLYYRVASDKIEALNQEYMAAVTFRHPLSEKQPVELQTVRLQDFLQEHLYSRPELYFAAADAGAARVTLRMKSRPMIEVIRYAIEAAGGSLQEVQKGKLKDPTLFYRTIYSSSLVRTFESRGAINAKPKEGQPKLVSATDALRYHLWSVKNSWKEWSGTLIVRMPQGS